MRGVRIKFWGVRGSIPTPGAGTVEFGGNTSCVEVRADGQLIVLDAGTGLRLLGRALMDEFGAQPPPLTILLSHTHWDHIQGLPFFLPLLRPGQHLRIFGYEGARQGLEKLLESQMETPNFPVGLREIPGNIEIEELKEDQFSIGPVRVQVAFANHPGVCVGYRLVTSAGSISFFPDNEPFYGPARAKADERLASEPARGQAMAQHEELVEFLSGTDLLIMDTQYDCVEYRERIGWGHGCLEDVVALAIEAKVKRLFLFHHDPDHDDAKVSQMTTHARELAQRSGSGLRVEAAREGAAVALA